MKLSILVLFLSASLWAHTYATTFPLTQNPIAENGLWFNGLSQGLDWTNILTLANTKAYGSGSGVNPGYDDSTAALQGASASWASGQSATGTVFISAVNNAYDQEVEIRLNTTISAHSITGYSCTFSIKTDGSQYFQVGRWNGPFGNFTSLGSAVTGIGPVVNGDIVSCQRVGGTITMYRNGSSINTATDSTYTAGSPGIGTDLDNNGSSTNGNFGFSQFTATDNTASTHSWNSASWSGGNAWGGTPGWNSFGDWQ